AAINSPSLFPSSSLFPLLLSLRLDFICDLPFVAGQSIHREMVIGDQACLVSFQRLVNVAAALAHRAPMFRYDAASQTGIRSFAGLGIGGQQPRRLCFE